MTFRDYLLLALVGLLLGGITAAFQRSPGYMDADYYYAGGIQLASGKGFTEPYLWNYLDDPEGLPHPSNAYWMPLASIVAAAGMFFFGPSSWTGARLGFLTVLACIPPVTAALAYSLASSRRLALVSGLLAAASVFYLPLLTTTDTFGLYMLLGGLFFLIISRSSSTASVMLLGLVAGLMHLSRADGLMWLGLALLAVFSTRFSFRKMNFRSSVVPLFYCFAGYLVIMGPWLIRNLLVFGTPLAPGGARAFWLTDYDQLFSFPADRLTFASWWHSGLAAIVKARLWALQLNLANILAVQGEIFLFPLIGIGCWLFRKNRWIQVALLGWILTVGVMTAVFPFAGARGGFIHSGAAFQAVWWAVAPAGLGWLISWVVRWRKWKEERAVTIFQTTLVAAMFLFTGFIAYARVFRTVDGTPAWGSEYAQYLEIGNYLTAAGAPAQARVVVANPPGFYLATGHPALALPDGTAATLEEVAAKYRADYLVLEQGSVPADLLPIYEQTHPEPSLVFLGEVQEARIFAIQP